CSRTRPRPPPWSASLSRPKRWRRSAISPAAWRMISTICSASSSAISISPAERRIERVADQLGVVRLERFRAAGEIEIADDDAEQIVEIMRHAAGEIADRLHLLRLDKLALQGGGLGRVLEQADDGAQVPVFIDRPAAEADLDERPVLAPPPQREVADDLALGHALDDLRRGGAILLGHDRQNAADRLLGGVAEDGLGGAVPEEDGAIGRHRGDGERRRFERRRDETLRLPQLRLRLPPLLELMRELGGAVFDERLGRKAPHPLAL